MKISKSKQELARIIGENGGWRDGAEWSAQQDDGEVWFCTESKKPAWNKGRGTFIMGYEDHFTIGTLIHNRHQCILSRAEYLHLYPLPDADGGSLSSALDLVTDENKHEHVDSKPTIEQLAADYRTAKDYAERKQQEADAAKADAEVKLKALELAGNEIGIIVSPITEVELGDEVECIEVCGDLLKCKGMRGYLSFIDKDCKSTPYLVDIGNSKIWCRRVKFIRRP